MTFYILYKCTKNRCSRHWVGALAQMWHRHGHHLCSLNCWSPGAALQDWGARNNHPLPHFLLLPWLRASLIDLMISQCLTVWMLLCDMLHPLHPPGTAENVHIIPMRLAEGAHVLWTQSARLRNNSVPQCGVGKVLLCALSAGEQHWGCEMMQSVS